MRNRYFFKTLLFFILIIFSTVLIQSKATSKKNETALPQVSQTEDVETISLLSVKLIKPLDDKGLDISGDGLIGVVKRPLGSKLYVKAVDQFGNPAKDITINHVIISQPDDIKKSLEIIPPKKQTDDEGIFKVSCELGDKVGAYEILFYTGDNIDLENGLKYKITAQSKNWATLILLGILGGLAILLYGMQIGGEGLQKLTGNKIRGLIGDLTKNRFIAVVFGAIITFFTQSSSATTVMLVSFAKAGLITLRQSLGLIFGAAIGTTITVQLISFRITDYALLMVAFGFLLSVVLKNNYYKNIGKTILGFGLIFFGIKVMSDQMMPLRNYPIFENLMVALAEQPFLLLIISALFTAVIQSSGATIAIAIALSYQNLIDLRSTIPIILGANIGTTATALLASIGAPIVAKRVAIAHFIFKTAGVLIFLPLMIPLNYIGELTSVNVARQIANTHTIFNVLITFIFILFIPNFTRFIEKLVPTPADESQPLRTKYLDLEILDTPPIAIGSAIRELSRMARFDEEMMHYISKAIINKDESVFHLIKQREDKIEYLQSTLTLFLTNLTQKSLTEDESSKCIAMLYIVSDLAGIGDIIDKNLSVLAEKMIDNDLVFSEEGKADLMELHHSVIENLNTVVVAITSFDEKIVSKVIENKNEFKRNGRKLHLRHLKRLNEGLRESTDTSSIHLDLINYLIHIEYHILSIANSICYKSKNREFRFEAEK